ncbi:hypothetical protein DFQ27_002692 [Actinomortierella ambigua]|uniref:50S ribosomal protein L9, chloroplastic n=1 Tax=Actinomortierella ambigua TaxID=1343610 RepID=A0A9P6U5Y5_9FUNG|nr:hypothetical protein DFQ27_002692 [Actinomortierella ambigua]
MFSASRSQLTPLFRHSAANIAKRNKSTKAIDVTLRANVEGLGKPGDVVSVKPGRMRNQLYPMRLASYIDKNARAAISASIETQDAASRLKSINEAAQQSAKKERHIVELQQLKNKLERLDPLVFVRAVNEVAPGSTTIFGSVAAEDVVKELKDKHGINLHQKLTVQGTKIKSTGEFWARVDLADLGTVDLKVVVQKRV